MVLSSALSGLFASIISKWQKFEYLTSLAVMSRRQLEIGRDGSSHTRGNEQTTDHGLIYFCFVVVDYLDLT